MNMPIENGDDMTTSTSESSLAERMDEWATSLCGQHFGQFEVLQAKVTQAEDDEGADAIFVELILSDPSSDTWSSDDVLQLRRAILEMVRASNIVMPMYVRLSPQTDEPQEGDDRDGVAATDGSQSPLFEPPST